MEAVSRMMRVEIAEKAKHQAEREKKLAAAVQDAIPNYMPGGCLYDLWLRDGEPYYKSEDEIPDDRLEKMLGREIWLVTI